MADSSKALAVGALTTAYAGARRPLSFGHPMRFRLRPIIRQGTAASLPAVWERFATLDAARAAVRGMYASDRVLRVLVVTDDVPAQVVEWVER